MSSPLKYLSRLESLFHRKRVALLDELRAALGTASRTTIFRILSAVGYLTSYSHAGRYYTLRRIPEFDRQGLWRYRGIGFSAHGTLRATLVLLIKQAPAGQTHEELQTRLGLRVQDTLRSLISVQAIRRERFDDVYLYLSADPKICAAQLARRRELHRPTLAPSSKLPLEPSLVIDVLIQVIHDPKEDARGIAARLAAAGRAVTAEQVEEVFRSCGLQKKTARSRSRPSQR